MCVCVCVLVKHLTSCVATDSNVSMTDNIGLTLKSAGAPFGGSIRRPLGSWSLWSENHVCYWSNVNIPARVSWCINGAPFCIPEVITQWFKRHLQRLRLVVFSNIFLFWRTSIIVLYFIIIIIAIGKPVLKHLPSCGRVCHVWLVYQERKQQLHSEWLWPLPYAKSFPLMFLHQDHPQLNHTWSTLVLSRDNYLNIPKSTKHLNQHLKATRGSYSGRDDCRVQTLL